MEKLIKIVSSPFNPAIEVVDKLVINLHVPYSEKEVTVQINPFVQNYDENQDQPGVQVRQVTLTTQTDETKTLKFDFAANNKQTIDMNEVKYEIKLMNIGKENLQGQDFPYFEFFIKWGE